MLYLSKPKGFKPRFEIVSVFLENRGKILLLHRHENKSQGGKWGVPAGKVEEGESLDNALKREVLEETGFSIKRASKQPEYFKNVFVEHPEHHFIYHMYSLKLGRSIDVQIQSHEHQAYRWVAPRESLTMNLVDDLNTCIGMFYHLEIIR